MFCICDAMTILKSFTILHYLFEAIVVLAEYLFVHPLKRLVVNQ